MNSTSGSSGPGGNIAVLRKARDYSQPRLAREAGISLSLLSKVEVGDRALSQGVAASLAKALGVTLDEVLGSSAVSFDDEARLQELRAAIRRFDLPAPAPGDVSGLRDDLAELVRLRSGADLANVLHLLPALLRKASAHAHGSGSPEAWQVVVVVYSIVYWLAARHRWMDLAELAVLQQRLAAERATPLAAALAARDRAGAFLNSGDFDGGLAVVEQAINEAESETTGRERELARGILHLRGLTLAGRLRDSGEAARHTESAWRAAEDLPADVDVLGITFGPDNTATHALATAVDLENYREALELSTNTAATALPPTRLGAHHLNISRAKLALRDRDGALASLASAWEVAPQMARVHPTSRELTRVLISLHKRSNPLLINLAKRAGMSI